MKRCSLLFFLLVAPCFAADLTGNWAVRDPLTDGTSRNTYLDLKQEGSRVTGTIRVTQFFYHIADSAEGPDGFTLTASMKERIARVEARVKGLRPPRVFLELDGTDPARPFTSGPRSFIGAMLQTAGGSNIAHEIRTPAGQMSLESIVAEDPEIIVLMDSRSPVNPQSREDVLKRRGWSGISAVRNGAIVSVDSALFSRPSPRLVEGIELLARRLHPEAFP